MALARFTVGGKISAALLNAIIDFAEKRNRQLDTTNDLPIMITQHGIGRITGNNTARITESITFPVAFSQTPIVNTSYVGFRATGTFNPAGLASSVTIMPTASSGNAGNVGCDVIIHGGGTLASANDWYYSWTATGVPA